MTSVPACRCLLILWLACLPLGSCLAQEGARGGLLQQRLQAWQARRIEASLPAGVRVLHDLAYGGDAQQRLDVYLPAHAERAPVIFLVHGGAWAFGDKAARGVVQNKLARWVPRGFVLISVDYRMLPAAPPLTQAEDVAQALAYAQQHAASWGADPAAFVLMGHSAGAHLVALLSAAPAIAKSRGAAAWLGTVSLDSAALDVASIMQARHLPLYDRAFGSQPDGWAKVSPYQRLQARIVPLLAVCSSRRDNSCAQAQAFVAKATSYGGRASVLQEDLSHEQINEQLGEDSAYTTAVESFMRSLGAAPARALPKS